MEKEKRVDGIWWDARTPERQWLGELRIGRRGRARLRIWMPEDTSPMAEVMSSYPLIYGIAVSGREFTLLNCFDSRMQGSFFNIPKRAAIFVNEVVDGYHCDTTDPTTSTASASFANLAAWWGQSRFVVNEAHPNVNVDYRSVDPIRLFEDDKVVIVMRSSPGLATSVRPSRVRLRETVSFEVKAKADAPLSAFEHLMSSFSGFLTVACHTYCGKKEFSLLPPRNQGEPIRTGRHIAVPIYRNARRKSTGHMLIQRSDFGGREAEAIGNWLGESQRLHDTVVLYLSGVYGSGFLETKLLALTQSVEAFHRQFRAGVYMDQQVFDTDIFLPLNEAIPKAVSSAHRDAIKSRLKFANEYSQRRRFQELFEEYEEVLALLVENPKSVVSPIVDHRNKFTHFPVLESARMIRNHDPMKVIRYNWVLRLLLEACLMSRMGFSVAETKGIVQRSSAYRQMGERFR